jgi:hypothetical protein
MEKKHRIALDREARLQAFQGDRQKARSNPSRNTEKCIANQFEAPTDFGHAKPRNSFGTSRGRKCSIGKLPLRNGLSAVNSISQENCLDRHLAGPRRNKAAIIWEGEPGEKRTLTYQQLHREVCRFANVLKRNKIRKGRSRHHLSADNSRSRDRDAGVRAHRRSAFSCFSAVLALTAFAIASPIVERLH